MRGTGPFEAQALKNVTDGLRRACKGVPKTPEQKQKMRDAKLGVPKSQEHKDNISKGMTGRVVSEETRKKISIGNKNRPSVKCHHCDKMGDIGSMTRWHMNNCKFKEHL
jgi:hypothetical protein